MNFTTQLKTWAASLGLAASTLFSTSSDAQGIDGFDTIALSSPTQILLDKSPTWYVSPGTFYSPELHNGLNDTGLTHNGFHILNGILFHGSVDTTNFSPQPEGILDNYYLSAYGFDPNDSVSLDYSQTTRINDLVLGIIDAEANYLNYQAAGDGYFYYNSLDSMYYLSTTPGFSVVDTVQLSNHPDSIYYIDTTISHTQSDAIANTFLSKEVFALANFDEVVFKENLQDPVNISIPTSLRMSPNGTIDSVEVDFGDGQGYRPLAENNSITYSSFGIKTIRIRRASNYQDHPITSKITFVLEELPFGTPDEILPFGSGTLPCSINYPFPTGKGVASVILQDSINKSYKKPFVIVEGFDRGPRERLEDHINDPVNEWGYGTFNFASFTSGEFGPRAPQLEMSKDFIGQLFQEGYDVIFIDFKTNGGHIESNALALVDFLSNELQPRLNRDNSTSQIPIIGVSMGGLIVRTALLMYEEANCCHNVNMYATFSTPHRGANIPISLQHAFNELGNEGLVERDLARTPKIAFNYEISCPAAQQMISKHILPFANQTRQNFQNQLNSFGQPNEVLRIGLTNGSATALGQTKIDSSFIQEGDELFSAVVDTMGFNINLPPYSFNAFVMRMKGFADRTLGNGQTFKVFERSEDVNQNILSFFLGHSVVAIISAVTYYALMTATPVLNVIGPIIWSTLFVATLNTDLNIRTNNFFNYNQEDKYLSGQHVAQDNVPGDYVLNFKVLREESTGFVKVESNKHSFVSTVSALDIDTSYYWSNVEDIWQDNTLYPKIPFDHIWYPGIGNDGPSPNQAHVEIDQPNIDWIINVLKVLEEDPSRYNGNSGSIGTAFNYGQPQDIASVAPLKFIGDVSVQPSAVLSINKPGQLYQGGFGNVMDSTHFVLKTANVNCETPIIRNLSGGTITVGDINGGNTADLVIRKGATLDLDDNSTLQVFEGSKVIIEEGATLIIGTNTAIHLADPTSQLVIRGKVIIQDHADFSFYGDGEIVYDVNDQVDYNERWEYGPNSTMTLTGNGPGDVVLRVEQGAFQLKHQLNFTNAFGGLSITNGDVILANGSLMSIASPLTLDNVTVDNDGTLLHAGLHLWGQANVSINNSTFKNGSNGIRANLTSFGNSLSIQNSGFLNCETGIWLHGKAFRIEYCEFRDNINYGIYAEDMEGQSLLRNSEILNNLSGVYFQGQEGTKLRAIKNDIRQNTHGVESYDCSMELQCNNISSNNGVGISSTRGRVFMNNDAGNEVVNNGQTNLFIYDCYELRLENGMNNFLNSSNTGPQSIISGCFNTNASGITLLSTGHSLSMTGNLPTASGTNTGIAINYCNGPSISGVLSSSYTNLGCAPNGSVSTTTPSHNHPHKMLSDILNSTSSNTVLSTANIQNELLNNALDNSLFLLKPSSEGGDILLALDRMDEILTYPYASLTPDEEEILSMTFKMLVEGYGLALEEGLIAKNRGLENTNENPYLQKINNYLSAAIQDVDPNDPNAYEQLFELKLDQAHVYRMTEHYDYALNALSSAEFYADAEAILRSDYWDCVCTAEDELLAGLIDPEEFNTDVENCKTLLQSSNKTLDELFFEPSEIISQDMEYLKITPNPTSISSLLEWTPMPSEGRLTISDVNGNIIRSYEIPAGVSAFRLFKEDLIEGVYFIRLEIGNQTQSIRWVII